MKTKRVVTWLYRDVLIGYVVAFSALLIHGHPVAALAVMGWTVLTVIVAGIIGDGGVRASWSASKARHAVPSSHDQEPGGDE